MVRLESVQVQYPNMLTLAIMLLAAWLTMSTWTSGNAFAAITLLSQGVIGMTTATITGGAYCMAAWLPPAYVQARIHPTVRQAYNCLWILSYANTCSQEADGGHCLPA